MGTVAISRRGKEPRGTPRNACTAAFLVALLFLLPLLANAPGESVQPTVLPSSGKNTDADVAVTDLSVTTPSVMVSGVPTLAPQIHIIRVTIQNIGGSAADGNLTLKVNGVLVDSRNVSINPIEQQDHVLYWDASVGSGYNLRAEWVVGGSSTDSDSSNDEMSLTGIAVVPVEDAERIADSLPVDGQNVARALWAGAITVVNTGNQNVTVTAQLTLTSSISGAQTPVTSDTVSVIAGSLANPPEPQNISLSFDGTNLEGTYTLGGSLLITGAGSSSLTIESRTITFTTMTATLIAANDRNLDPGASSTLNFILQNSGTEDDTFIVIQSNTSTGAPYWVNAPVNMHCSVCPAGILEVSAGATSAIQVEVSVPVTAGLGDAVSVTISVQSVAMGYLLEATTTVMAGGLYEASIMQNHSYIQPGTGPGTTPPVPAVYVEDFANITPGTDRTIDYTLKNTGTAPTQYQINVGAIQPVPYWNIFSPVTITDVVMPGEERTIPVTIITPEIEMPLDPSWKVWADLQINLAIQAIPLEGGVPATNQTTLIIDKYVEIDVSIIGGANDIGVDDFLSGNTDRFVDFAVELKNNLGSDDTATQIQFTPISVNGELPGHGKTFVNFGESTVDTTGFEHTRWTASMVPSSMEVRPGQTGYGTIAISHHPTTDFPYPAAGVFSYSFEATSGWGGFPGAVTKNSTGVASISIEEMTNAELTSGPTGTGDPGTAIATTMTMKNTGNHVQDFTIGHLPLPGWTVQISKPSINSVKSRTNLYPLSEGVDNSDSNSFTVTATPPATASADTTHQIWIAVNATTTKPDDTLSSCQLRGGFWVASTTNASVFDCIELLAQAPAYFQLTELVSAELIPENSTAVIDRLGQTTILLQLNNTGNSNKTFNLSLNNLDPDKIQVSFADDGTVQMNKSQLILPGGQAIVRVYALAGTDARADIDSKFEVAVSNGGTEYDRSGIMVQVNPFHFIQFMMNEEYTAAPGATLSVPIDLVNHGNLMERVNITATFPSDTGNWTFEVNASNVSIEPGIGGMEGFLASITLPPMESGVILSAGVVHNVTIRVMNVTENIPIATTLVSIEVLPVFAVNVIKAPDRIAIVPGHDRIVSYEIENAGNAPMSINLQWTTTDSDTEEDRFSVNAVISSTTLDLDIGESTSLTYSLAALHGDHYRDEAGTLDLIFTPLGISLDPITITTPIQVVRVQSDDEYYLNSDSAGDFSCDANADERCRQIEIPWTNIPSIGYSSVASVNYTLSRTSTDRLISSTFNSKAEWAIDIDQGTCQMADVGEGLSVTPSTAAACNGPGWDLPTTIPYDLVSDGEMHGGLLVIQVIIPDKLNLASGDGWDIKLRIENPDEPSTSAFWTEFTVKLRMTESSDPLIERVSFGMLGSTGFVPQTGIEGSKTKINVLVVNAGTARMPSGTEVQLLCSASPYATVVSSFVNRQVPDLEASGTFNASWDANLGSIPWYSTSEHLECSASLIFAVPVFGNNITNDVSDVNLEIQSWTTPPVVIPIGDYEFKISSAFIAGLFVLFGALVLLSRGLEENPNSLHASAYLASMAFGIISLGNVASWLTAFSAMSAVVFAGVVAWLSSSELQTIHDDRKKARIGTRAVLEDHDKEQENTRKELRAIISCAPLAFLPFVLVTPSLTIEIGTFSLLTMLIFIVSSPILVHFTLRILDRSYDKLYSELAEIELRAIKIKKILGSLGSGPGSGGD
ncbi:MAG: hypothetical protein QGH38_02580 [Candidatus Thalassarchaeaceae archaeon]|nr:hypothetical protein [Candidatus Thalassarchaeaceae archaeon]